MHRLLISACAIGALTLVHRPLRANPQECIAANDRGGEHRAHGKFVAARLEYLACASEVCPRVIRDECVRLVALQEALTPTIALVVVDSDGNEVRDARVLIDGKHHAGALDKRTLALDPGRHVLRLERGEAVRELEIVLHEREKLHAIRVQFPRPAARTTDRSSNAALPAQPLAVDHEPKQPMPLLAYALIGSGVAALGSFAYFALAGSQQERDFETRCAPHCRLDEVDAMRTKYLIADLSLLLATLSFGGAAYVVLSRPSPPADGTARHGMAPDGIGVGVQGNF
jgi:hypothetical protein